MTSTKRTLKPAGYIALAVLGLLAIGLAMTAWHWVDTQFIHPYGYGIPTHLAATFTPTPQVVATQQLAATSELDALPPLVTATPPGTSSRATPSLSPTATGVRAVSLPWAGEVTPGKPVPDKVVKSITASWDEVYKAVYDYQNVKANGKPGDKTWWINQVNRFFVGAERDSRLQGIESWFKPDSADSPGFIENGRYTVNVEKCTLDTECVLKVQLQSGQAWAYNVGAKAWTKANALQPADLVTGAVQYDLASGRWKYRGAQ